MIALVSYVEEMRVGWRDFDLSVYDNLQRTFKVDVHWYIAKTDEGCNWYYNLKSSQGIKRRCVTSLENVYNILSPPPEVAHVNVRPPPPKVAYVNVQPPSFFKKANVGMQWLKNFEHPKGHVCYVFGGNHGPLETVTGDNVAIDLAGSSLFSFCAAAIILYDRRMKEKATWEEEASYKAG